MDHRIACLTRRSLACVLMGAAVIASLGAATAQQYISAHGDPIAPSGLVTKLPTLPLREVVDPTGKWLAIINGGFARHGIVIVQIATGSVVSSAEIRDAYEALDFSTDGKMLLVGGSHRLLAVAFNSTSGQLGQGHALTVDGLYQTVLKAVPGGDVLVVTRRVVSNQGINQGTIRGVTTSDSVGNLSSTGPSENFSLERIGISIASTPTDQSKSTVRWSVPIAGAPSMLAVSPDGQRAFVADWLKNQVSIVDLARPALVADVATPAHPAALALAPKRGLLYVACAATNRVAIIDVQSSRVVGTIDVGALPGALLGATPNALALSPDELLLYVANADENAIIKVRLSGNSGTIAGAIQVGDYPTDVLLAADGSTLFVLDGKGEGPVPNPLYRPYYPEHDAGWESVFRTNPNTSTDLDYFGLSQYYVGNVEPGFLERIDLRLIDDTADLNAMTKRVHGRAADAPALPPIAHVIYIIKENRSYDQVLGDDPRGNGDPSLAMFGAKITPNIHALVDDFVLADNYVLDGEVSEDGWPFAISGYAPDDVQRAWPSNYAGQPLPDGLDGAAGADQQPGGYLWDRAFEAGRSVRLYSIFPEYLSLSIMSAVAPFVDDPDNNLEDDDARFGQWLSEFKAYEATGKLPALEVMSLSGDHTQGTSPYYPTPNADVAKNDYYVGRIVDTVSHSGFWRNTVICFTEDDAQNGPDHVSSQRSYLVVAGGLVRRKVVDHTRYSLTGLLRTIEVALGLKPMTEVDATATVMSSFFSNVPDNHPYRVLPPQVSLTETNPPHAIDAKLSKTLRFDRPDENNAAVFNKILWDYAVSVGDLPRGVRIMVTARGPGERRP
jgi:DNA-binding beta-propeller fold protein YncE